MRKPKLAAIVLAKFYIFCNATSEPDACWVWSGPQTSKPRFRYGQLHHNKKRHPAHRLSWQIFKGPIPKGLSVLHHCDNPPCVNPNHLFVGTQADNMKDRFAKGRFGFKKGSKNPRATLTSADIIDIRTKFANGTHGQPQLAKLYKTFQGNISLIVRGKAFAEDGGPITLNNKSKGRPPLHSEEQIQRAVQMYNDGSTYDQITEATSIKRGSIAHYTKNLPRRRHYKPRKA